MISPTDLDLLERYLARELSAEEEQQLEARLRTEQLLARQLVTLAREEAMLVEWARALKEAEAVTAAMTLQPSGLEPILEQKRRFRPVRFAVVLATLTACLLLVLLPGHFHEPDPKPEPNSIAKLRESFGEVAIITRTGEKHSAQTGRRLYPGDRVETGGKDSFAVLQFASRARLEIGSDSLVELPGNQNLALENPERISVLRGFVRGELPEDVREHPMFLSTPLAEVEMRGKKFSSWSEARSTLIELEEGRAQLVRRTDGQRVRMEQGTYVLATSTVKHLVSRPLPTTIETPELVLEHGEGPILAMVYSPKGDTLTTGGWRGTVKHWDPEMGQLSSVFRTSPEKKARVLALGYSTDGKTLITSGPDRELRFWEPMTGKLRRKVTRDRMEMKVLAFSPDRSLLGTIENNARKRGVIRIYNPRNGKLRRELSELKTRYVSIAFFPDNQRVALGTRRGFVQVWDWKRGKKQTEFRAHRDEVQALTCSREGRWLASSARRDHLVRVWTTDTFEEVRALEGHGRGAQALAFSPIEDVLAIASDGVVKIWHLEEDTPRGTLRAHIYRVTAMAFSPDGMKLATAGWKKTAKVWDLMQLFCAPQ